MFAVQIIKKNFNLTPPLTSFVEGLQVVVHGLALERVYQSVSFGVKNGPTNTTCPLAEGHLCRGITIVSWQIAKCVTNEPVAIFREGMEQGIDVINTLRKYDTLDSP